MVALQQAQGWGTMYGGGGKSQENTPQPSSFEGAIWGGGCKKRNSPGGGEDTPWWPCFEAVNSPPYMGLALGHFSSL